MSARKQVRRLAAITLAVSAGTAHAIDVLRVEQGISATPAGAMVGVCAFGTLPARPLQLREVVERALCSNPKTRARWADVKAQAAAVGVARAAYLPTLSATWQGVRDKSRIDVDNHPLLGSDIASTVHSESVSLNWLLYDFGGREAGLRNARSLLEAARATQDATLQEVFAAAAKDYYAAQTAVGALAAAAEVEDMTRRSMIAAQARVDKGIAPVTDALQAQTQHEQVLFGLTKAESELRNALGTLASDMDLDPDALLEVPPVTTDAITSKTFGDSVEQMMAAVRASHPSVRAAQAQYDASLAKVTQTRAQGLPSVSLVGKYSRNNQPQSLGLGMPTYPATGHDAYIGVQVSFPLFEGFGRYYQIHQAVAQAERQEDVLDGTRRQVALDVWRSYQTLTGATRNTENSANLLAIAERSWEGARRRYNAGVGNILELLATQTALANAKQRRIQALADWNDARVDLASKLGALGHEDMQ
ncbi:TolC family protein [Caballeronia ptereochthonis]|uniref:Protein CyaE n=1 Tax=Caballeronia ptereochthonis TaxID=1777144 RepID=A0A158C4R5_9BURK|nr:TolC family protein [Caballeronia ptereochthonis]SAK77319.1 Fis family transcriptional regulator [Caballeronia ptereochthonis]